MPDPSNEAAVQRSRLRINEVWQDREVPERFVRVLGYDQHLDGMTSLVRYAKVVRQHAAALGNEAPDWIQSGSEKTASLPKFNERYRLFWEDGNKELGGATDLTDKLKQIRRDPGRPVDLIGDLQREYRATHPMPEGAEAWWRDLDARLAPAAFELSRRRIDLLAEIGDRQAEVDRIDAALDALASMEAKEGE